MGLTYTTEAPGPVNCCPDEEGTLTSDTLSVNGVVSSTPVLAVLDVKDASSIEVPLLLTDGVSKSQLGVTFSVILALTEICRPVNNLDAEDDEAKMVGGSLEGEVVDTLLIPSNDDTVRGLDDDLEKSLDRDTEGKPNSGSADILALLTEEVFAELEIFFGTSNLHDKEGAPAGHITA